MKIRIKVKSEAFILQKIWQHHSRNRW